MFNFNQIMETITCTTYNTNFFKINYFPPFLLLLANQHFLFQVIFVNKVNKNDCQ